MADIQPPRVDNEIVQMWRRDGRLYAIAGFLAGVMLFPLLASLGGDRLTGFLQELVPELVGIGITIFLIDRILQRRDERNSENTLKQQLLVDVRSTSNEVAKNAVHQLRSNGWLVGNEGLLKGADLSGAHLEGAELYEANLEDANLFRANLQGANLSGANLQGAELSLAKLQKANLSNAHLRACILFHTEFDGKTILPSGLRWSPNFDLTAFTDLEHPYFWKNRSPRFRN